jgi:hypothetical protein
VALDAKTVDMLTQLGLETGVELVFRKNVS